MTSYKESWDLATSIVRWGALLIGGACILVNSAYIGRFPEDLSLGEGILLYMLSFGFLAAYALYWLGVTAVGLWLLRWPMHFLKRWVGTVSLRALAAVPADYRIMWSAPVWVSAGIAATVAIVVFQARPPQLLPYLEIAFVQGFFGGVLLLIQRRLSFQGSGLSITRDKKDTDVHEGTLRRAFVGVLALWILWPLFFVPDRSTFFDAAFRAAQLRKDDAVIHVRSPWSKRLTQTGLAATASFLGPEYSRFDGVRVRLRSIGRHVVLAVPDNRGATQFIGIPREYIEVE